MCFKKKNIFFDLSLLFLLRVFQKTKPSRMCCGFPVGSTSPNIFACANSSALQSLPPIDPRSPFKMSRKTRVGADPPNAGRKRRRQLMNETIAGQGVGEGRKPREKAALRDTVHSAVLSRRQLRRGFYRKRETQRGRRPKEERPSSRGTCCRWSREPIKRNVGFVSVRTRITRCTFNGEGEQYWGRVATLDMQRIIWYLKNNTAGRK